MRRLLPLFVVLGAVAGCEGVSGTVDDAGSATGGGAASTGGGSASTGGGTASTGGGSASTGGGTASTGGGTASTGGGTASTGGGTASTGGGTASTGGGAGASIPPVVPPDQPAVARGSKYRGFNERFNRYYTDPSWTPSTTVYVSPNGSGNGQSKSTPTSVSSALASVTPGTRVFFTAGTYNGCYQLDDSKSGTYDAPVVLTGERGVDGSRLAQVNCCTTGRKTCFNLEGANYVAIEGFEVIGSDYGVRAVGLDYAASQHQVGVAVLSVSGHDQNRDPFFTGASDWYVIERVVGYNAGTGDGHGIYLSNGSDWAIVRFNELYNNRSSDFQINADPASTCTDIGIDVSTPDCDAVAGTPGDGGRGASDFMLVEGNFFHHGLAQGANFTSARNAVVRNNIFAFYARHGVSFWQETGNPRLGAANSLIAHNLFVANVANRQMLQFVASSNGNTVENNVFVGVGGTMLAMEVDDTVSSNVYTHNAYYSASLNGRTPNATEFVNASFDSTWFQNWPTAITHTVNDFAPSATAPFLNRGALLPLVLLDRAGVQRHDPTDLGPIERP